MQTPYSIIGEARQHLRWHSSATSDTPPACPASSAIHFAISDGASFMCALRASSSVMLQEPSITHSERGLEPSLWGLYEIRSPWPVESAIGFQISLSYDSGTRGIGYEGDS